MAETSINPTTADIVVVEWEDIVQRPNWNEDDGDDTTLGVVSVGWLIEDNEKKVVIAGTYNYDDGEWSDKTAVPKLPPVVTVIRKANLPE